MNEKKLAVFVEGQTERLFVERLIIELAGKHKVNFDIDLAEGGGKKLPLRRLVRLQGERHDPAARFYVQIVDSHTDNRVVSDIRETQARLAKQGFEAIIGIRDVYPSPSSDVPRMRATMKQVLIGAAIPIDVVLAIMEVEAWFLAEHNHFAKIGNGIALDDIVKTLVFDPRIENVEDRYHPADDLHRVYQLAGCAWKKEEKQIQRTINALDYAHLCGTVRARMTSLRELLEALDRFLT